jgi:predicted phage terminase large subunit-like protein
MFQQRPQSDEDAVLDPAWFQQITVDDFNNRYAAKLKSADAHKMQWGRFWDLASTKEAGDYTSGTLALWDPKTQEFFIRHVARGQWSSHRVESEFAKYAGSDYMMARQGMLTYKTGIEKEPGSSGEYTVNHFKEILRKPEVQLGHVKFIPHPATSSKLLNAQPLLAAAEAGKVYVVCDYNENGVVTGWAKDFFDELEFFPESEHDDQVDSTSQAYKTLTGRTFIKPTFGRGGKTTSKSSPGGEVQPTDEQIRKSPIRVTFGRRLALSGR